MNVKKVFAGILAALIVVAAFSQAAPTGEIEYMEGKDLALIRNGLQVRIQDPIGMKLFEGDFINTGKQTYLEVKTLPKGDILKIAENTSLRLSKMSSGGESSLQLLYGRIRAKVGKLSGTESFKIRSASTAAGVRGTDFGYDVLISKGKAGSTDPVVQVYCFEGAVEVTTMKIPVQSASSSEQLEPIPEIVLLNQDEMVTIEKKAEVQEIKKQVINEDIKTYWKSVEPLLAPKSSESGAKPDEQPSREASSKAPETKLEGIQATGKAPETLDSLKPEPAPQVDFSKMIDALSVKNATIWTGVLFSALGVGAQAFAAYNTYSKGNASLTTILQITGTSLGACGLVAELVSVFINPVFPEAEKKPLR